MTEMGFYRRLPNGTRHSVAGYGCSSFWAKPSFPDAEARSVLEAAQTNGLNLFDTGPSYGGGLAERRLGSFLADLPRADFVVSTKVGTHLVGDRQLQKRDFDPRSLERSLTGSLDRLRVDRVDFLYLHGPPLDVLTDELVAYLEQEKARGRVIYSGVNSFDSPVVRRCIDLPIDAVMLQLNVADDSMLHMARMAKNAGKQVFSATALAQAVYETGTFLRPNRKSMWYLARALRNGPTAARQARSVRRSANAAGTTGIQRALEYVSRSEVLDGFFFGTTNPNHMASNLSHARALFSDR